MTKEEYLKKLDERIAYAESMCKACCLAEEAMVASAFLESMIDLKKDFESLSD